MDALKSTDRFHELHAQLRALQSSPSPDLRAIDEVIVALEKEQLRLKAVDGQPGNTPIEAHRNLGEERIRP